MCAVYLDNAASTQLDRRVAAVMRGVQEEAFGNPSSVHGAGTAAARAVERARFILAQKLGASPDEIVFTSGGTESNNCALFGAVRAKGKVAVSAVEHPSVLEPARQLKRAGSKVSFIGVDFDGLLDLSALEKVLRGGARFISVMHANNEVGTVQPLEEVGALCRKYGAIFHTDACQSFGKLPLDVNKIKADLVTVNAHKMHGPKGVGALYVRKGVKLTPLMWGGGQELGLRSGTLNTPAIAGFGAAVELCSERECARIAGLRNFFIGAALAAIPGSALNGHPVLRLCNNVNLRFEGVQSKELLLKLSARGIFVSSGSACSAGKSEPSHVLLAMGQDRPAAASALRVSLGRKTTKNELELAVSELGKVVKECRKCRN